MIASSLTKDSLLFGNIGKSVPEKQFQQRQARESLLLVQPGDILWITKFNSYTRRNQALVMFRHRKFYYELSLTDPSYVGLLKGLGVGQHLSSELGIPEGRKILFTISLGEPFDGFCYKLIAAIVVVPSAWDRFFPSKN